MRFIKSIAVLLGLFLGASYGIAAQSATSVYSVYVSGIKVGRFDLTLDISRDRYAAAGNFKTSGLTELFFSMDYRGKVNGARRNETLLPRTYSEKTISSEGNVKSTMRYRGGVPNLQTNEPRESHWLKPSTQKNTLDPLSAMVQFLRDRRSGALCDYNMIYFDGARRMRVKIAAPQKTSKGVTCRGVITREGGFSKKEMKKGGKRFKVVLEYAPARGGLHQLERLKFETARGRAVLLRQ